MAPQRSPSGTRKSARVPGGSVGAPATLQRRSGASAPTPQWRLERGGRAAPQLRRSGCARGATVRPSSAQAGLNGCAIGARAAPKAAPKRGSEPCWGNGASPRRRCGAAGRPAGRLGRGFGAAWRPTVAGRLALLGRRRHWSCALGRCLGAAGAPRQLRRPLKQIQHLRRQLRQQLILEQLPQTTSAGAAAASATTTARARLYMTSASTFRPGKTCVRRGGLLWKGGSFSGAPSGGNSNQREPPLSRKEASSTGSPPR